MFYDPKFAIPQLMSVIVSILFLVAALRAPGLARALFVLLFAWACDMNWTTALSRPAAYLEYAPLAVLDLYRDVILGPFARHVVLFVGAIATCQGLIAVGFLLGGLFARVAAVGAIIFFVAILPLGVGAGFPSTLIAAAAAGVQSAVRREGASSTPAWALARDAWARRPAWLRPHSRSH